LLASVSDIATAPRVVEDDVTVHIMVTTQGANAPVKGAYVALIPRDQPLRRPAREMIAPTGNVDLAVPAGRYLLRASADMFDTDYQRMVLVNEGSDQVVVSLAPEFKVSGMVADPDGHPITDARITHMLILPPPSVRKLSELAAKAVGSRLHAMSDVNGFWQLAVSTDRKSQLMVEARGYAPAWVVYDPAGPQRNQINVTLHRGSSLKVAIDRLDPNAVLTVIAKKQEEQNLPPAMQAYAWAREATTNTLVWDSLPDGHYRIFARYPDPLRFGHPVEVGEVTLTAGEVAETRVHVPPAPEIETTYLRFMVPRGTSLAGLRAFTVAKGGGVKEAAHSEEDTIVGKVVYVAGAASLDDVYLTTDTQLIVANQHPLGAGRGAITAVEAVCLPRGSGKLRVTAPTGVAGPSAAIQVLHDCGGIANMTLPASVLANGEITLPLAVACKALTLQFENFTPLTMGTAVGEGEQKWLGEYRLLAPSSAAIHVVRRPSGTNAAGAIVQALVRRGTDVHLVVVAEATADQLGHVLMKNVPAGENVTFQARDPKTQLMGSTSVQILPAKRAVIEPLEIPEPASLTVAPVLDSDFKSQFPTASIMSVSVVREDTHPPDRNTLRFDEQATEVVFHDVAPGYWHIMVLVNLDSGAQPMEVDAVSLASGEDKHVSTPVRPVIATGLVLSKGQGVRATLLVGDPPSPAALQRRVYTASDGTFKVVLPKSDIYYVKANLLMAGATSVDFGPLTFDGSVMRLVLPDGSLGVHVTRGGQPLANARLVAVKHADNPDGSGVSELSARAKTDANGAAVFQELSEGIWAVQAQAPDDDGIAERDATIAGPERSEITLDIDEASVLEGTVTDVNGGPAASASVDCVFSTSQTLQSAHGDAGVDGHFVVHLPVPAPQSLQCGVTTVGGAIAAFQTPLTRNAAFVMPPLAGGLFIADWGRKTIPDRFWLVGGDGSLFNLSWVAKKVGRFGAPLTIARLPAGRWTVVQILSTAQLFALGSGVAPHGLVSVADATVAPGQSKTINVQNPTAEASR
jgi:hypothetical protein